MANENLNDRGEAKFLAMTPAHIREPEGADHVQVMFLESARFYKLFRVNKDFAQIVEVLRQAVAQKRVVHVRCTAPHGDVIAEVKLSATS